MLGWKNCANLIPVLFMYRYWCKLQHLQCQFEIFKVWIALRTFADEIKLELFSFTSFTFSLHRIAGSPHTYTLNIILKNPNGYTHSKSSKIQMVTWLPGAVKSRSTSGDVDDSAPPSPSISCHVCNFIRPQSSQLLQLVPVVHSRSSLSP